MPPSPVKVKRARYSKGDLVLAASGLALAILCATFPWYIFYNQEQFGVRALQFNGNVGESAGPGMSPRARLWPDRLAVPDLVSQAPDAEFDPLATGTLPSDGMQAPPGLDEQPFPARPGDFRLIHVANGRAMIEDEHGLWIVQRGSVLPDESRVSSIEQRAGRWVLVTDTDRVVAIAD